MKHLAAAMLALAMLATAPHALAESVKQVAIHVDDNDPGRMTLALNNAANIHKHYEAEGLEVEIAIVANGPGLHMFRADTSPVKDRIATMSLEFPSIRFQGCGNTHAAMTRKADGVAPEIIEEVQMIPSGAVQLMELQFEGWAYLKP